MTESILLFLVGAFGVAVIARLYGALWPAALPPASTFARVLFLLSVVVVTAPLAWLVVGALQQSYSLGGWTFVYWVVLGNGAALLVGCLAGLLLAASLDLIDRWGPGAGVTTAAVLAAGPAASILLLYLFALPGVRQSLGLTSISAGGVEITLTAPTTNAGSFTPAVAEGTSGALREYTPWFQNLWPTLLDPPDPMPDEFMAQGYFQREAAYLGDVDHISPPLTEGDAAHATSSGVAGAFWAQQKFLRSLRPAVGCAAFYHLTFPDIATLRPRILPFLEQLVAVETDLEQVSLKGSATSALTEDLNSRRGGTAQLGGDMVREFRKALPPISESDPHLRSPAPAGPHPDKPSTSDSNPPGFDPKDKTWKLNLAPLPQKTQNSELDITVEPPYLAMFIANSYAALGSKDTGLKVLDKWLTYYNSYKSGHSAPKWLYDRAMVEYGIVQEADEPYPTTKEERFYLEKIEEQLHRDWQVDLDHEGWQCGQPPPPDLPTGKAGAVRSRFVLVYDNVVWRLLAAALATKSGVEGEFVTIHHYQFARKLLAAAERCLPGENAETRDLRQNFNRVFAGYTLARWAIDGPRAGVLANSDIPKVRKDALMALLVAIPYIRGQEAEASVPDGVLHVEPAEWETHRRRMEKEIIDLETALTN